jgi:hypothetical protein
MKEHGTKTYQPAQQETGIDRVLQLLCIIAQTLHRIEQHLRNAGTTPQTDKIIRFNGGGRR